MEFLDIFGQKFAMKLKGLLFKTMFPPPVSQLKIDVAVRHTAWRTQAWREQDWRDQVRPRSGAAAKKGLVAHSRNWVRQAVAVGWHQGWNNFAPTAKSLSLVYSDDAAVRELNRIWRGQDKATNVLSFPSDFPPTEAALAAPPPPFGLQIGDVILAYETVMREAVAQKKPLADHTAHLVIHGVLHLLGYDHQTEQDAARMEALEIAALGCFDIGNPYLQEDHIK
ncbi:MAG: rRNA maturation RNase YbeY [Candidatus Symbiobacter sp.]|nr:rRNA maturation RNase YbeY [Candidatus Symbiobacter sp.]